MDFMKNLFMKYFILLFLTPALMFSSACALKRTTKRSIQSSLSSSYYALGHSDFKNEIALREKMLFGEEDREFTEQAQAELFFQLVILYSHRENPEPDFVNALKYLKQYALIRNHISVEYADALLATMVENNLACDILYKQYESVIKENVRIKKNNSTLILKIKAKDKILQENQEVIKEKNEIIEKLKALDIKMENRRAVTE